MAPVLVPWISTAMSPVFLAAWAAMPVRVTAHSRDAAA